MLVRILVGIIFALPFAGIETWLRYRSNDAAEREILLSVFGNRLLIGFFIAISGLPLFLPHTGILIGALFGLITPVIPDSEFGFFHNMVLGIGEGMVVGGAIGLSGVYY